MKNSKRKSITYSDNIDNLKKLQLLRKQLERESVLVCAQSLNILQEFENIDEHLLD